jgi:WD40 repeat protein
LWDATTAKVISSKRLPKGSRLVTAIGISATDKYICASDAAEKITCHIFEVDGGKAAIATVAINMKVVHLAWSPVTEELFGTAGKDHVTMCTLGADKKVKMTKGKAKGGKIESQAAIAWLNDKQFANHIITGASDGKVYHWAGDSVVNSYDCCEKGAVTSVACRVDQKAGGEVVIAGGKDKSLTIYKFNNGLTKIWAIKVDAAPLSVDLFNGMMLLGLKNGSIVEMPYTADGKAKVNVVMTSHCDGEVWGLDVVDIDDKGDLRVITSADDNRILTYKPKEHLPLAEGKVSDPPKKKPKAGYRGGASSMSSQPAECQSRAVAYDKTLKHLAVAGNTGLVTIREIDWAKVDAREPGSLDKIKYKLFKDVKKAEWIEAMVYSPDSKNLAVGSHDNMIYIVDTKSYKKVTKLTGHSSFITSLDWSVDGSYIRSNCGAYELLFFNITNKKRDPSGASNTIETIWADQTCKLGWNVQGIFPSGCDGSHINSVAMSKDGKLIASGDDYGLVCLYRNPLLEGHASSKYRGHSEFVTSVKFSPDNQYLWSTGGQDQTTI